MKATEWVRVTREDGETVGWIEPLDPGYASLQPRDVLGHAVGGPTDWAEAEERLQELGLAHVAGEWLLDSSPERLAIAELSPAGIRLSNAVAAKALAPSAAVEVPWPDVQGRLRPAP